MNKSHKKILPNAQNALAGRDTEMPLTNRHFVHGRSLKAPFAQEGEAQLETIYLGLGCFWGAERKFWTVDGVYTTAVGYGGGITPNPSYEEVCTGLTGHTELVLVVFDKSKLQLASILKTFFESHDPTQGMRQGNDIGTQYRSMIACTTEEQMNLAKTITAKYQNELSQNQYSDITTEIVLLEQFYYAEDYHQQYLAKNPNGYCGIGGTGVTCPI